MPIPVPGLPPRLRKMCESVVLSENTWPVIK